MAVGQCLSLEECYLPGKGNGHELESLVRRSGLSAAPGIDVTCYSVAGNRNRNRNALTAWWLRYSVLFTPHYHFKKEKKVAVVPTSLTIVGLRVKASNWQVRKLPALLAGAI